MKSATLASASRAPDSSAFHCVALRSANGRPRARAQPPPRRRREQKRRHCPGARREASLTLRCVPLRENRRDRRRTPASASPVLASETLSSSLASAAAWSCAGPQCQPHLWPGVRSACLKAHPVTPEPRPGAPHSQPEVRERVPPRPKRSAPDCQLSARDRMVLKSWQTGA